METIDFLNTPLQTLAAGAAGVVIWELGKTLVGIMQSAGDLAIAWIDLQSDRIINQMSDDSAGTEKRTIDDPSPKS